MDYSEDALYLTWKLFKKGEIDQAQRDKLKELVYDEDPILLGLFKQKKLIKQRVKNFIDMMDLSSHSEE